VRRLSTQIEPDPESSTRCQDVPNTDDEVVCVLKAQLSDVQYTMVNPRERPNACSCHTAIQGQTCHHQISWLLVEYPYAMKAEQPIVDMLGTRFGCHSGCSMDDIRCLTEALNLLELAPEGRSCDSNQKLFLSTSRAVSHSLVATILQVLPR
jgi:hypothetical protein